MWNSEVELDARVCFLRPRKRLFWRVLAPGNSGADEASPFLEALHFQRPFNCWVAGCIRKLVTCHGL